MTDKMASGIALMGLMALPCIVASYRLLRKENGLSRPLALFSVIGLLGFAAAILLMPPPGRPYVGGGPWFTVVPGWLGHGRGNQELLHWLVILMRMLFLTGLPLLGIPFVAMLGQKWLGSRLTEAERAPGREGIRAWLRPRNLIWAAWLVIGLWIWLDLPMIAGTVLFLLLLTAYPEVQWVRSEEESPSLAKVAAVEEDDADYPLRAEREQVLRMVEEKKITADEGVQLLNALAATAAAASEASASSSAASAAARRRNWGAGRKLALAGAGVVVVAFFLPWLSINPARELSAAMRGMTDVMRHHQHAMGISGHPGAEVAMGTDAVMQSVTGNTTIWVSGGGLKYGLGWMILALCAVAALLSVAAPDLGPDTRRTIEMIALGVAGVLLLYVISTSWQFAALGLVLVVVGYLIQLAGALKEWRLLPGGVARGRTPAVAL